MIISDILAWLFLHDIAFKFLSINLYKNKSTEYVSYINLPAKKCLMIISFQPNEMIQR